MLKLAYLFCARWAQKLWNVSGSCPWSDIQWLVLILALLTDVEMTRVNFNRRKLKLARINNLGLGQQSKSAWKDMKSLQHFSSTPTNLATWNDLPRTLTDRQPIFGASDIKMSRTGETTRHQQLQTNHRKRRKGPATMAEGYLNSIMTPWMEDLDWAQGQDWTMLNKRYKHERALLWEALWPTLNTVINTCIISTVFSRHYVSM